RRRGDDGRRKARALSPRGRPAARRVLPRGHAPWWRRPRAAAAAAGENRRRDRARRGRGDDEGARHRLPPQPARGLAHRDPRPPASDAAGLRPRAVRRDLFASDRPHRQGIAGRVRLSVFSRTVREMIEYLEPVLSFVNDAEAGHAALNADASDLQFGNPQEMPLPEIQQALTRWAAPQNKDWFAYKFSDPKAIQVAVQSLRKHIGIEFDPADVSMTTGAFGGLASTLRAVLD